MIPVGVGDAFGAAHVRIGHTYGIALARGVIVTATIIFERLVDGERFVRFASPALKQPGYCTAARFADCVNAAREG